MSKPISEWTWIQHDKYDWSIVDGESEVAHVEAEYDDIQIIQQAIAEAASTADRTSQKP